MSLTYCDFAPFSPPGRFRCRRCGIPSERHLRYGPAGPPRRHCPVTPEYRQAAARLAAESEHPEILEDDLARYAAALLRWQAAGFPVRERTERDYIRRVICPLKCDRRDRSTETCTQCPAAGQRIAVKAWMATEGCPLWNW
jgi:hypothetical protein